MGLQTPSWWFLKLAVFPRYLIFVWHIYTSCAQFALVSVFIKTESVQMAAFKMLGEFLMTFSLAMNEVMSVRWDAFTVVTVKQQKE